MRRSAHALAEPADIRWARIFRHCVRCAFPQPTFPWPRPFPQSTRRALPSSSSTSLRSVLRTRPTPRRTAAVTATAFPPVPAAQHLSRPLRGLPVPVLVACDDVPNSSTSTGAPDPRPTLSDGAPWPSAADECVGSNQFVVYEAVSPGPPSRSPTLRPAGHPNSRRKD
jgi:hypothetical protein